MFLQAESISLMDKMRYSSSYFEIIVKFMDFNINLDLYMVSRFFIVSHVSRVLYNIVHIYHLTLLASVLPNDGSDVTC